MASDQQTHQGSSAAPKNGTNGRFFVRHSLSTRLLWMTVFFVMLAEVFIYVPSIANFRQTWIREKLISAEIAILAIEASPDYMVSEMLTKELLDAAGVTAIVRQKDDNRRLVLATDQTIDIVRRYDLRNPNWLDLIVDTFRIMLHDHPDVAYVMVKGYTSDKAMEPIEIIFDEELLCKELMTYSRNILFLSIFISIVTAFLVFLSLSGFMIRPVREIIDNMIRFRESPEDLHRQITPRKRKDEMGVITQELADLQEEVRKALIQKNRQANLGIAVNKINHDLRNILSSAQLVSDHLGTIDNPVVKKLAPRFMGALDRGVRLCENTLQYGAAESEKLTLKDIHLAHLIDDVKTALGHQQRGNIIFENNVPVNFRLNGDADQLHRVFLNLTRNAAQAMDYDGTIQISAEQKDTQNIIIVEDNGPGIPEKIQENLFTPFHSNNKGGTGLGLAISKEIIEAHGGILSLVKSDQDGSIFEIILP